MSKIYVFANGEKYISVGGKCYIKTDGSGPIDTDSSLVTTHDNLQDCTGAKAQAAATPVTSSGSTTTTPPTIPVAAGTIDITSTFYSLNLTDLTGDEADALVSSQEDAVAGVLGSVSGTSYTTDTKIQSGSIVIRTTITPHKQIFNEIKQIVHTATTKGVNDVTGFLHKLAQRVSYRLKLLATQQTTIDKLIDNIQTPDVKSADPVDDPVPEPEPAPVASQANEDDHQTWVIQTQSTGERTTLNIPLSAEPKYMSYVSHKDACWALIDEIGFDATHDVYDGITYTGILCELEWPELDRQNGGANWEVSLYYGLVERGWYVSEWYSSSMMSHGSGFNKRICLPRDRLVGIRFPSDHEFKIAQISINPDGYIMNGMTAKEFKDTVVDVGDATLQDIELKIYPAKDEKNVAGQTVNNKFMVFGGDFHLSMDYPTDEWYIYYSNSHPEMIGWLRVIDTSEDCRKGV